MSIKPKIIIWVPWTLNFQRNRWHQHTEDNIDHVKTCIKLSDGFNISIVSRGFLIISIFLLCNISEISWNSTKVSMISKMVGDPSKFDRFGLNFFLGFFQWFRAILILKTLSMKYPIKEICVQHSVKRSFHFETVL